MIIAARNSFLMSGTQPYKRELPYLHIGSGQYIVPNWVINQPVDDFDTITSTMRVTALTAAWDCYWGGWNGPNGTFFRRYDTTNKANSGTYFRRMPNSNPQYTWNYKNLPTTDFESVGFDLSGAFWGANAYNFGDGYHSYSIPFAIGALNNSGEILHSGSEFDIASLAVYARGTTLAHDIIPVLDWSDTPCLYDRATGESWYNAGSGTLGVPPWRRTTPWTRRDSGFDREAVV